MDYTAIITSLLTFISGLASAYLLHQREIKKHILEVKKYRSELSKAEKDAKQDKMKLDFFNRAMDLSKINPLIDCVEDIFSKTRADRFLILIAVNGHEDFNIVSVIFEQHKKNEYKVNAIGTYRNVKIDTHYKKMLKEAEFFGSVCLDVQKMPICLLKDIYENEGVNYSIVNFLSRQKIDNENDFVVYSSIATHDKNSFTRAENAIIKLAYESVITPNITDVMT